MKNNKRFEQAAKRRKYFAIAAALLIHAATFAAISNDKLIKDLLPDFLIELVEGQNVPIDDAPRP